MVANIPGTVVIIGGPSSGGAKSNPRLFNSARRTRCWHLSRVVLLVSVMLASFQSLARAQGNAQGKEPAMQHPTSYRTTQIDGLSIFFR